MDQSCHDRVGDLKTINTKCLFLYVKYRLVKTGSHRCKKVVEQTIERNLSGAAQMLALAKNWKSTASQKDHHLKIIAKLKKGQQKNGRWDPRGQLPGQKRELEETSHVITLWNSLALINVADQAHVDKKLVWPMAESAKKYVDSYDGGKSSEWLALRALFARKMNDPEKEKIFLEKLTKSQNEDGGWGWITGDESDVLATSQIVYALSEMGKGVPTKAMDRATGFLVKKQSSDGSWKVKGTKEKAKKRFTETANYWGSAWAVIALSRVHSARSVSSNPSN